MGNPCTSPRYFADFLLLYFAHEWVIFIILFMPALDSLQLCVAVWCLQDVTEGGSWNIEHVSVSERTAAARWYLHQELLSSRDLRVWLLLKCCNKSLNSSSSWSFTAKISSSSATGEPCLGELSSQILISAPSHHELVACAAATWWAELLPCLGTGLRSTSIVCVAVAQCCVMRF